MKHCTPDWNIEGDLPLLNLKRSTGAESELVELLWQNGQVVMHSQTNRKPGAIPNESKQVARHEEISFKVNESCWNSSSLIQDDETVSWIQFPIDDSMEKDFCSNLFTELSDQVEASRPTKEIDDNKFDKPKSLSANSFIPSLQRPLFKNPVVQEKPAIQMPPPKFQMQNSALQFPNSAEFARNLYLGSSDGQFSGKISNKVMKHGEARECSVMTIGSSHCGSNQIANEVSRASSNGVGSKELSSGLVKNTNDPNTILQFEKGQADTIDPTLTSSSGGSGSSFMQSTDINSHKRKSRNAEDSECQSDGAELESAGGSKQSKRSSSTRRSRAAEVHNLSERRRRDRINEKMKALQELIPNSNKSDKASMLDEAIEYMKSLQLQLQMMWMGSGMTPMMFPGVQHYMSRMGMGICPTLPSIHNSMHLPRVPMVDQSIPLNATPNQSTICQSSVMNPLNYQNQLQNHNLPEQYAHCLGLHHIQAASQPANIFGVQPLQQSQNVAPPGSSNAVNIRGAGKNDSQGGKLG